MMMFCPPYAPRAKANPQGHKYGNIAVRVLYVLRRWVMFSRCSLMTGRAVVARLMQAANRPHWPHEEALLQDCHR